MNSLQRIENGFIVTDDKGSTSKYYKYDLAVAYLFVKVSHTANYSKVVFNVL